MQAISPRRHVIHGRRVRVLCFRAGEDEVTGLESPISASSSAARSVKAAATTIMGENVTDTKRLTALAAGLFGTTMLVSAGGACAQAAAQSASSAPPTTTSTISEVVVT